MKYLAAEDSDHMGSSVLVDDDNLEVAKEFYYLGTVVISDNDISSKFQRCILMSLDLDQVKRALSEIKYLEGWEAAARDRVSWRIIVDRAMSRRRALSRRSTRERER